MHIPDLGEFFERLRDISDRHELDFIVSVSADLDQLGEVIEECELMSRCLYKNLSSGTSTAP